MFFLGHRNTTFTPASSPSDQPWLSLPLLLVIACSSPRAIRALFVPVYKKEQSEVQNKQQCGIKTESLVQAKQAHGNRPKYVPRTGAVNGFALFVVFRSCTRRAGAASVGRPATAAAAVSWATARPMLRQLQRGTVSISERGHEDARTENNDVALESIAKAFDFSPSTTLVSNGNILLSDAIEQGVLSAAPFFQQVRDFRNQVRCMSPVK